MSEEFTKSWRAFESIKSAASLAMSAALASIRQLWITGVRVAAVIIY